MGYIGDEVTEMYLANDATANKNPELYPVEVVYDAANHKLYRVIAVTRKQAYYFVRQDQWASGSHEKLGIIGVSDVRF